MKPGRGLSDCGWRIRGDSLELVGEAGKLSISTSDFAQDETLDT